MAGGPRCVAGPGEKKPLKKDESCLKWPDFKVFLSFRVGEVLKFVQMNKI